MGGQIKEELWITNVSKNKDITISDLRITIRRGQNINLLARSKGGKFLQNFTKKDIENSIKNGSLNKLKNVIKIREVKPVVFNHRIDVCNNYIRDQTRLKRKATEIEEVEFPDLDFDDELSDEDFAAQNAEMDFEDRRPVLAVDPIYKISDE